MHGMVRELRFTHAMLPNKDKRMRTLIMPRDKRI